LNPYQAKGGKITVGDSNRGLVAGLILLTILGITIAGADPLFADGYEAGQDSSGILDQQT